MSQTAVLRTAKQQAKETSGMFRLTVIIVVMAFGLVAFGTSVKAQNYIQTNADVAYWNAFNRQMTPVYNGARRIQQFSNGVVNYGSRLIPQRYGTQLRQTYNQTQRYVQRNVTLPQRYYPNQSGYRRR